MKPSRAMWSVSAAVLLALPASGCRETAGRSPTSGDGPGVRGGDNLTPDHPPVTCQGAPDKSQAITPAGPGRKVYCAIDLGSNNAKLVVLSMEPNRQLSFRDERQCRSRLGFGALVFDAKSQTASPLPQAQITNRIGVVKEFQQLCALDQGVLVGAEATQWARDATNIADVAAQLKAATGLDLEVLTPEQEGQYGYLAATRNTPERLALDPGSNSFQLSWLPRGAPAPRTVSVPVGYVRAASRYYPATTTETYQAARASHAEDLKTQLNTALARLSPPTDLAALRAAVAAGELKPELFIVGQDGALHLAVRASLRDASGSWLSDPAAYAARLEQEQAHLDPTHGEITTLLRPPELASWFDHLVQPADFLALRSPPVRTLYGEKALANAVLADLLTRELGLTDLVLVPQEMPAGYILSKLR